MGFRAQRFITCRLTPSQAAWHWPVVAESYPSQVKLVEEGWALVENVDDSEVGLRIGEPA